MTRAQETAQGIAEVLGLPVETDEDLYEVRQSDAFYLLAPDYGDTGTLHWMPTAPRTTPSRARSRSTTSSPACSA